MNYVLCAMDDIVIPICRCATGGDDDDKLKEQRAGLVSYFLSHEHARSASAHE